MCEPMTKEEMQRFLILEAERGTEEVEAYRKLMEIIGIEFPQKRETTEQITEVAEVISHFFVWIWVLKEFVKKVGTTLSKSLFYAIINKL